MSPELPSGAGSGREQGMASSRDEQTEATKARDWVGLRATAAGEHNCCVLYVRGTKEMRLFVGK